MATLRWLCILPALLAALPVSAQKSADRPLPAWLVLGTFPVDSGATRVTKDYLPVPEATLAPAAGEVLAGKSWRVIPADTIGRIDFQSVFLDPPRENAVAYALTYVTSPADRTVVLEVHSDDDAMIWLNGDLVYHVEVPRGVAAADTLTVRLARGVNRLLYKVVNRSGGFGMGAQWLPISPDSVNDLTTSTDRPSADRLATGPAPTLTIARPTLALHAQLQAGPAALEVPVTLQVARWGGLQGPVTLRVGDRTVPVPDSAQGWTVPIQLPFAWSDLAAAAAKPAAVEARLPGGRRLRLDLAPGPGQVLDLLSRLVDVKGWQRTSAPHASLSDTATWRALGDSADASATALGFRTHIPATLAGLDLAMEAAEFTGVAGQPGAVFNVNDRLVSADSLGRVALCSPCAAGAPLAVVIQLSGGQWWDAPRLRVLEPGWREVHEGARWARYFTRDSSIALPDDTVARSLLAAARAPDKQRYHAIIGDWLKRLEPAARKIRADTLDLVGNSHIDAAWLWRWTETVDVVRNTWRTATKLLRKYPDMTFAASAARYYTWLEQYEPELLHRIQALERQGRWAVVGGFWVESDANMPAGESVVRQGLYGQDTFIRLFGHPSTVAWIPDTFGYAWTLPQIFRGLGLQYLITQKLRWNDTNHWPSSLDIFWWQGRDGTRLLTYIPYGYSSQLKDTDLAHEWQQTEDSAAIGRMLTLYGVGDHGGGPTMAMLDRKRDLERIPTFPALRDVLPAPTMQSMRAAMPADGPVVADELYLEYHRGVLTTQAAIKHWNRHMEGLLGTAEAAAAIAPGAYPRTDLTTAWTTTLFNQFHDILPGSGIGPVYKDAVVDYLRADSLAEGVLTGSLNRLASILDTQPRHQDERPYFVFNPNGRTRTGIVRLDVHALGAGSLVARSAAGQSLRASRQGDTLAVLVPDVPATGGILVFVGPGHAPRGSEAAAAAAPNVIENENLRLEIDPATGDIAQLYDKRAGRDVFLPAGGNTLATTPDRPKQYDAWNLEGTKGPWTPLRDSVVVEPARTDPLGPSITVHRSGPAVRVTQRYVLRSGRVDIQTTIDWHADHELLKAMFPLAVHADSVWAEIPYGAIGRPTVPHTAKDSARWETSMQRWVDVSADSFGVAIANDGKYGFNMAGDTLRISLLKAPKWPDPNADMGTHHFTYSIVPHGGDWRAPEVLDAAEELNQPLRAVAVQPHPGQGRATSLLEIIGGSAILGALKRTESNDGTYVVRLVEHEGRPTTAVLRFAWPVDARPADLLERPLEGAQAWGGQTLQIPLRPWEIRTLLVVPRR